MNTYGIINDSEQLRNVTGSWWANADFSRIERIVRSVESELAAVVGNETMQWIATGDGRSSEAWTHAACAVGYMACMRYYRLNDISHQDGGRKVKIDRDNEARPFEWQLARDDRAHLEEYYRALDRLLYALQDVEAFADSDACQQMKRLIVRDSRSLTWLTGIKDSPWTFLRMVPFLAETQDHVQRHYGSAFTPEDFQPTENTDTVNYAAQKATALGAIALMGRRTSLQLMPYAMMQLVESDGGGNQRLQPTEEQLARYLTYLSRDQHYWVNEMKIRRDRDAQYTYLHTPDNRPEDKFIRL